MATRFRSLDRTSTVHVVVVGAGYVLTAATGLIIAGELGPQGRGNYALLVTSSATVGLMTGGGLFWSGARLVTAGAARTATVLWAVALSNAFGLVGGLAFVPIFAASDARPPGMSWVIVPIVSATAAGSVCGLHLMQALGRLQVYQFVIVAYPASIVVGLGALLLTGSLTAEAAMVAWLVCSLVLETVALADLLPRARTIRHGPRWTSPVQLIRSGFASHASTVLQHVGFRGDLLVVVALVSAKDAGLYSFATALAELAWLPSVALSQLVWRSALKEALDIRRAVRTQIRATLVGAALVLAMSLMLCWLVLPRFSPAVPLIAMLLPGVIIGASFRAVQAVLLAEGRNRDLLRIGGATAVAALILYPSAIAAWGAVGGAMATSTVYLVQAVMSLRHWRGADVDMYTAMPETIRGTGEFGGTPTT